MEDGIERIPFSLYLPIHVLSRYVGQSSNYERSEGMETQYRGISEYDESEFI